MEWKHELMWWQQLWKKKRYFRFLWFSVFRFLFICFPFSLFYDVFYIQFSLSLSFYLIFTYFCCFSFTFLFQSFSFRFFFFLSFHIFYFFFLSIFIHMLSSATLLLFVQYCSCVCVRVVRVWINPFKIN